MPGIELRDYTQNGPISLEQRDALEDMVHQVIERWTKRLPGHSSFMYTPAGPLDKSGYDYLLVVDAGRTEAAELHIENVRFDMKNWTAQILEVPLGTVAVRYRLMVSSFG